MDKCLDVNISKCFWCGGDKNEILIGKKFIDCDRKFDNKEIFTDYSPCDKCKEDMDKGFVITECTEEPNFENQPPIQEGAYPTSRLWIIETNTAEEIFTEEIVKIGQVLVDPEVARKIGLYRDE
jgi:hypothetical protein